MICCNLQRKAKNIQKNRASVQFVSGRTALHCAASQGHEAIVKLLLENGADVMVNDNAGRTALSLAAGNGHEAVVKLLLENGAGITAKDIAGRTALCLAAAQGRPGSGKAAIRKGLKRKLASYV